MITIIILVILIFGLKAAIFPSKKKLEEQEYSQKALERLRNSK